MTRWHISQQIFTSQFYVYSYYIRFFCVCSVCDFQQDWVIWRKTHFDDAKAGSLHQLYAIHNQLPPITSITLTIKSSDQSSTLSLDNSASINFVWTTQNSLNSKGCSAAGHCFFQSNKTKNIHLSLWPFWSKWPSWLKTMAVMSLALPVL